MTETGLILFRKKPYGVILMFIDRGSDRLTWDWITKSLSNEDILKSLNRTNLVEVQRTVTKKGTTFVQNFWVRPNQVKKTDRVLFSSNSHKEKEVVYRDFENGNIDDLHKFFGAVNDDGKVVRTTFEYYGVSDVEYTDDVSKKSYWGKMYHSISDKIKRAVGDYTCSGWTYALNNFLRGAAHPSKGENVDEFLVQDLTENEDEDLEETIHEAGASNLKAYQCHLEGKYHTSDKKALKAMFNGLNAAISKSEVPEPFKTIRFISRKSKDGTDLLDTYLKAGKDGIIVEHGFSSSAPLPGKYGVEMVDKPRIRLNVRVPKGKDIGIWAEPLSLCRGENEFIFASESAFKMLTDPKDIDVNSDEIAIELEYVGHGNIDFDEKWQEMKEMIVSKPQKGN